MARGDLLFIEVRKGDIWAETQWSEGAGHAMTVTEHPKEEERRVQRPQCTRSMCSSISRMASQAGERR